MFAPVSVELVCVFVPRLFRVALPTRKSKSDLLTTCAFRDFFTEVLNFVWLLNVRRP